MREEVYRFVPPDQFPDTSYLSELDKQTLAEDGSYRDEVLERHPTVFLRPDDRTGPRHTHFVYADADGVSYIGFIKEYTDHKDRKPPVFHDERIKVRMVTREAKKISEITEEEFKAMYSSVHDQAAAIEWLEHKYPQRKFEPDSIVTLFAVEYFDPPTA